MKNVLKIATVVTLSSGLLVASGWRLPESSSKSTALSGAYIANSNGADATYYNPANMSFNENSSQIEIGLMNVYLPKLKYEENSARDTATNGYFDGETKEENSLLPSLFLSSKDYGNGIRYGFSLTVPGGLTRRWDTPYQKTFAQEFSLKIIELNPTVAYKVSDNFSIGGGIRAIYSSGVVKSDGVIHSDSDTTGKRDLEGDTTEYGYNLALAYKPSKNSNLSLTYRSNIDLKEDGDAKLYLNNTELYNGGANVTVPLPAALTIAYAFKVANTTIELVADRTYWSSYKNLDFEYDDNIDTGNPLYDAILKGAYDDSKERDWKDTDAFRIGITHKFTNSFVGMLGYSKDGNPIPEKSFSFESPDYNSHTYSFGFDYRLNDSSSFGFGYLYSQKDDRDVTNSLPTGDTYLDGKISNAKAHLVSLAYRIGF